MWRGEDTTSQELLTIDPSYGRNLSIMRAIDFSNLHTGDVILCDNAELLPEYYGLSHRHKLYIVASTNGTDTALVIPNDGVEKYYTFTQTEDGYAITPLDGTCSGITIKEAAHFTAEEADSISLFKRARAQAKLGAYIKDTYRNNIPLNVGLEYTGLYKEKVGKNHEKSTLANIAEAYEAQCAINTEGEKHYRAIVAEDLADLDQLITTIKSTYKELLDIAATLPTYQGNNESVTITAPGRNSWSPDETYTFHTGTGIINGDNNYLITRLTKTRAHLTNPETGNEEGYIKVTKADGISYELPTWHPSTYEPVPANTAEDLTAQQEATEKANELLHKDSEALTNLHRNLNCARAAEDAFLDLNDLSRRYTTFTIPEAIAIARTNITVLEGAKEIIADTMESFIRTVNQLTERAYGA